MIKHQHSINSFLPIFLLLLCSFGISAQDFNVSFVKGHEYSYKPSISERLNGIKDVVVFAPKDMSEYDKYIYPCIANYFRGLGMKVSTKYVRYKVNRDSQQYLETVWKTLDEDVSDYWDNANTLLVVANNVSSFGKVTGRVENTMQIYLIDPVTEFEWTLRFDLPSKSDKFDKKLRSLISQSYVYNPNNSHSPSYYKSSWTENSFKTYFSKNSYTPLEGVYEGDNYKVGVKQDSNGKLYLVYLSGASNQDDWKVGDIKAVLEPTATPTVFKAKWYGKWKQIMNYTIIFKDGLMNTYDEDKNQEAYIKLYPALISQTTPEVSEWSGTGFALKNGYIVTNYHVVENANTIVVKGIKGDFAKSYPATIVASDKFNDLAIIKISDSSFVGFGQIPYSISSSISDVGEDIFVLGYPLTSTMGDEIKLTTGVVSSKTGYQGDVALYQISAPIQPGNSGGPLFDKKGNVIGIVSAKHSGAENVGYAIKSSYLRNLIESTLSTSIIPATNSVSTLPLTGKVKAEKNFVFYIECSQGVANPSQSGPVSNSSNNRIIYNPSSYAPNLNDQGNNTYTQISKVELTPSYTGISLILSNYAWCNISPQTYIKVGNQQYQIKNTKGIEFSPNRTVPSQISNVGYHDIEVTFYFPPIPINTQTLDLIEPNSRWQFYNINLRD